MRARELLEAAISLGDASSKSGGESHNGDSRRANGLPEEEDEEGKDVLVASATARTRMGRLLLGGLYMQEDVVRARKLLLQARLQGEQSATRCQLFTCVCECECECECECVCGVVVPCIVMPCAVVSCLVRACVCVRNVKDACKMRIECDVCICARLCGTAFSENWRPVMTCAAPEPLQLIVFSN